MIFETGVDSPRTVSTDETEAVDPTRARIARKRAGMLVAPLFDSEVVRAFVLPTPEGPVVEGLTLPRCAGCEFVGREVSSRASAKVTRLDTLLFGEVHSAEAAGKLTDDRLATRLDIGLMD